MSKRKRKQGPTLATMTSDMAAGLDARELRLFIRRAHRILSISVKPDTVSSEEMTEWNEVRDQVAWALGFLEAERYMRRWYPAAVPVSGWSRRAWRELLDEGGPKP